MNRLILVATIVASFPLAVMAEDAISPELKSQEDWLRYSNWEKRSTLPKQNAANKSKPQSGSNSGGGSGTESGSNSRSRSRTSSGSGSGSRSNSRSGTQSHSTSGSDSRSGSGSAFYSEQEPAKVSLPDNPGSQTVEGAQATIPGWALQPAQQEKRSPEIMVGRNFFGSRPVFLSQPGNWNFAPTMHANNYLWGSGIPFAAYQPSFSVFRAPFAGRNYWQTGFGTPFAASFLPFAAGWPSQSRLGPEVIETGPSPASGNYYKPSSGDSSASGNYYQSGVPWQIPVSTPETPKDYWGPAGNPFK